MVIQIWARSWKWGREASTGAEKSQGLDINLNMLTWYKKYQYFQTLFINFSFEKKTVSKLQNTNPCFTENK